ncbi:MAG: hypothetical protein QOK10_3048 [Pseudonocardiales bacterium]|nr:hypothetical protein [Pseudonocardiales bacterium]
MSDLDRYLIPTEVLEVVVRRHWASQVRHALIFTGLVFLSLFVLAYLPTGSAASLGGGLLLLGSAGWFSWMVLDWRVERFIITDKRVLLITGLLTKRVAIMPLSKVTDLTFERSVPGRILGYGVFVMESAGQQQALSRIDYLPTPDELYQQVSALLFGPRTRLPGPSDRLAQARTGRLPLPEQSTTPLPRIR